MSLQPIGPDHFLPIRASIERAIACIASASYADGVNIVDELMSADQKNTIGALVHGRIVGAFAGAGHEKICMAGDNARRHALEQHDFNFYGRPSEVKTTSGVIVQSNAAYASRVTEKPRLAVVVNWTTIGRTSVAWLIRYGALGPLDYARPHSDRKEQRVNLLPESYAKLRSVGLYDTELFPPTLLAEPAKVGPMIARLGYPLTIRDFRRAALARGDAEAHKLALKANPDWVAARAKWPTSEPVRLAGTVIAFPARR